MAYGFTKTELGSVITLSEQLRHARERAHLSLSECATALSIQEKYLAALEQGRFADLPGDLYGRAWVKKYASFLGLPETDALTLYAREVHVHKKILPTEKPEKPRRNPFTQLAQLITVRRIIVTVISLSILSYLVFFLYQTIKPPTVTFARDMSDFRTSENNTIIKGKTELGTIIRINDEPLVLDNTGAFEQSITLHDGLNTVTIVAQRQHSRPFTKIIRIVKTKPPELENTTTTGLLNINE